MKKNGVIYLFAIVLGLFLGFRHVEGKVDFLIKKSAQKEIKTYDGWRTNLKLARDDQGTLMRAVVAKIGLGANTKEEAIYLTSTKDTDENRLNSEYDYKIVIEKDLPVDAFWSITLYGEDDYLIENDFDKHGLSSFQNLERNEDGTITISLSKEKPENDKNWIPLPKNAQNLTLTLRCYNPKAVMLNDLEKVELPAIYRIGVI